MSFVLDSRSFCPPPPLDDEENALSPIFNTPLQPKLMLTGTSVANVQPPKIDSNDELLGVAERKGIDRSNNSSKRRTFAQDLLRERDESLSRYPTSPRGTMSSEQPPAKMLQIATSAKDSHRDTDNNNNNATLPNHSFNAAHDELRRKAGHA